MDTNQIKVIKLNTDVRDTYLFDISPNEYTYGYSCYLLIQMDKFVVLKKINSIMNFISSNEFEWNELHENDDDYVNFLELIDDLINENQRIIKEGINKKDIKLIKSIKPYQKSI